MELHGLHHVTAVTADAPGNLRFYAETLGLRLVKKTVNQDDVSAYHLFYADALGTPGTDMTFFDWPQAGINRDTNDGIVRTMFRVNGAMALEYWKARFNERGVKHSGIVEIGGKSTLRFEDPEGQRLALIDDGGAAFDGKAWDGAGVPVENAIRGFYAVELAVPQRILIEGLLTHALGFVKTGEYTDPETARAVAVFSMDGGGPGREVHVSERPGAGRGWLGAGGGHHVAFRVKDAAEQLAWQERLAAIRMPNSGVVERFYFKSLYFRITDGILFELATDGPGFSADEDTAHLGEKLALPPFLEPRRAEIEAGLKPLETKTMSNQLA